MTILACQVLGARRESGQGQIGKSLFLGTSERQRLLHANVTVFHQPASCSAGGSTANPPLGFHCLRVVFQVLHGCIVLLLLSLSQQQSKGSVGGCGTMQAWVDRVTWNTGSEHKQGHCSLEKKKKTWQKQHGSKCLGLEQEQGIQL